MNDVRPFEEYKEMIQDMSKEEMIRGLYDISKNIIDKENEIKTLMKKYENAVADYEEQKYIINELENYLIEQVEKSYSNDYDNVLDKLDELKGVDKE